MQILNIKLLSHPLNWITVFLMLILAATFGHLILSLVGIEATTSSINPNLAVGQSNIGVEDPYNT